MGCWIAGGAGFFLFSVLLGRRATGSIAAGTWRRRPSPGWTQRRALSPDFPAGARGLYPLARGCRIRPARGMAPALMVGWIAGGAGFFLFSVLLGRRATGSIAAGTWRRRPSPGWTQRRALSPDFPAGARGLYPLARGCRIRPARGMAPALMGCWIAGGAGFFLFSVLLGRRATGSIAAGTWRRRPSPGWTQRRALSPDFPAGARGLYPLARGCRIRPARGMAPALMGCWIAGGAGFFLFSVLLGRRATGSIAAGTWRRRPSPGWTQRRALSPDFPAGARGLYPLARGCRIRPARGMAPALMGCWIAGGAGFFLFSVFPGAAVELPGRSRPAPGVSTFAEVWPTSTFPFSGIVVGKFGGGRWSSGSAPMLMSASPGRGGGDGAGAGRAQRATGSSTTIAKFRSTDSGSVNRFSCPYARARRRRFQ